MLIGHFTEQPWQDDTTGLMGTQSLDLSISNGVYDPKVGAKLYNRYLDEKIYADQIGFDALMLNEHHSTPFCMQGVTNVGASILARETKKSKIIILGNILPIWDDPLWLAEQLAMIDMISYGRLVSGFVRGGGRESVETVKWTARHRYPLVLLATKLEPTKEAFQLYHDTAAEEGYESGTQNVAYLWKVHVDETEELAEAAGRKFLSGVSNPFLAGNEGAVNPAIMNLPGHTSRTSRKLAATAFGPAGRFGTNRRPYEDQVNDYTIISGTPKTILPKIRHVLEYLRPGSVFFWDGDGAMSHEDQMRSLRLMGEEVIPAIREMGKELELFSPFEVDPNTGKPLTAEAGAPQPATGSATP